MARPKSPDLELYASGVLARLTRVDSGYGASTVLTDVDFEVRVGDVALVTGPAAAGKTTLTHFLRLAMPVKAGRAVILGVDAGRGSPTMKARAKRRIGYVAENPTFVEHWTAFDNIAMPLKIGGAKIQDYTHDVRELVDFVGLGAAADLPVEQISNAERQRTALARALAAKPDLIIADDPTSGMSPSDGRRIVRLLAEMRRVGAGIVITSQDESLADSAPCMRWTISQGRLTRIDDFEPVEAYE